MQIPVNINQCYTNNYSTSSDIVLLVQGDTNPPLVVSIINETYNSVTGNTSITPIDVSSANVILKIRKVNSNNVFATVIGTKIAGLVNATTGEVSYDPPYDILGLGGRVAFFWESGDLSESGNCEGEVSITYLDENIKTVYNTLPIKIRKEF